MDTNDYIYDDEQIVDLNTVKEEKQLKPAAKDVLMYIKSAEVRDKNKDGSPKKWKTIGLQLQLINGINVDGEQMYINSIMFKNICFAIDKTQYAADKLMKPFFNKQQYLVELKQLLQAVGASLTGMTPKQVVEQVTGKQVLASILQVKEVIVDKNTGEKVETGDFQNEVKYFKAVPDSYLS